MSIQLSGILDADCGGEFGQRIRLLRRTALPYQEGADDGGDTVRGPRHSERVEQRLNELLPDVAANRLWPRECYVLIAAAIVHDLGYAAGRDRHWEATCDLLSGPPVGFAEHIPGQSFWANTLGQLAEFLPAVSSVIMLHGAGVDPDLDKYAVCSCGKWGSVIPRGLGGFLRLADDLDTGLWRVRESPLPAEDLRVYAASGKAQRRRAIKGAKCIPDDETVIIQAEPESPEDVVWVNSEFDGICARYLQMRPYAPDWARFSRFMLDLRRMGESEMRVVEM